MDRDTFFVPPARRRKHLAVAKLTVPGAQPEQWRLEFVRAADCETLQHLICKRSGNATRLQWRARRTNHLRGIAQNVHEPIFPVAAGDDVDTLREELIFV